MFFNPAALGWVDQIELQAVATLVAPKSELKSAEGSTVFGTPIGGPGPARATSARMRWCRRSMPRCRCPAGVRLGLGVNVPFGLETDYPDDWVGRYHGGQVRAADGQHQPGGGLAAGRPGCAPAPASRRSTPTAR